MEPVVSGLELMEGGCSRRGLILLAISEIIILLDCSLVMLLERLLNMFAKVIVLRT
jgi:hypothetical protein